MTIMSKQKLTWWISLHHWITHLRNPPKLYEVRRFDATESMTTIYLTELLLEADHNPSAFMRSYWGSMKNGTVHDLAPYAAYLKKLQIGSQNTNSPLRNKKRVNRRKTVHRGVHASDIELNESSTKSACKNLPCLQSPPTDMTIRRKHDKQPQKPLQLPWSLSPLTSTMSIDNVLYCRFCQSLNHPSTHFTAPLS